jgi:sec-independent protein translocase protein TatC
MNEDVIKAKATAEAAVKAREKKQRPEDAALSIDGPVGDEELPILEHFEELRKRLIVYLIPFCIATIVAYPASNLFLRHVLFHNLFPEEMAMFVYSPMEWMSVRLLCSFLIAFSVTLPVLLYELFAFIRPGLYPSERKFFLMVLFPSVFCYAVGAVFAYYFVLPTIFRYLINYSGDVAQVALSAKRIFSLILYTAVSFGLIFQIPFVMTLAAKLKIVSYSWLRDKRVIIYGLIIGIAFFVIADPTGISMIMALVSIVLFEFGLLLTRCIGHRHK